MQSSLKDKPFNALKLVVNSGEDIEPQIADALPSMVLIYEADHGHFIYLNQEVYSSLGYESEEFKNPAELTKRIISEDDRTRLTFWCKEILQTSNHGSYIQLHLIKEDGAFLQVSFKGSKYHHAQEHASSVVLLQASTSSDSEGQDENVEAKDLLSENEQLLNCGSWVWSIAAGNVEWSDGLYTLLEYDKEQLANEHSMNFFLQHLISVDQEKLQSIFQSALQDGRQWEVEVQLHTNKGTRKTVCIVGKPKRGLNGEIVKLISVVRDITEQDQRNKNLTSYRQMMLDKEKFLGSGSWESNLANGELSWSDGKYRLFGYDPDKQESLPSPTVDLYREHVSEEQLEKMKEQWMIFMNGLEEHTWEYELTTVQGDVKILETYGRLIRDADGKPLKVIGASRDVTKIREYEESLKFKIEELDRSNKELEEFAYIASHDLQEPLRKITAFSERLKDRAGPDLGTEGNIYLDRMLVATQNMRLLIDNLLEFSRTSRYNQPFAEVDLNKIIREVLSDLELKIEETHAVIEFGELPTVAAIASQMRQLFTNLISNAIKFRKPGQIPRMSLTSQRASRKEKDELRLKADKNYYRILLKDEGIGFEKEYAVKIFQIFQRLHGKSEYPGSGIGLAICKKIAENHHGLIYADSEPGEGAAFTIILPETQA